MRRPPPPAYAANDQAAYRAAYRVPSDRGSARPGSPGNRTYNGRNSDLQNPYLNTNLLGVGALHPLPIVPAVAPPAPAFGPVQPGGSRPSWDLAGIGSLLGPFFHIPIKEDYQLNWKLRESIPLIDATILRMKDLIGFPEVEAADRLKRDIDGFLQRVPVNRIQFGAETWLRSHLDNAYTFGRSHTEIVLTADRRDVFGLVEVYTPTCGLRPTFDGFALNVVQYQYGGGVPLTLVPELLLTSVHDFRGDDPNGNSLIASLPFVSQILIKIYDAMRQTWERWGCPNYWVNWEPPDTWNDPDGTQGAAVLAPIQQALYSSDLNRANGKIQHVVTTGKVTLAVMGADGQVLEFTETAKEFAQQILAKTGIPPFMLGLSWSTTERMSTAQAKLLTEVIEAGRMMVEPQIRQLIDLRQRLVGRTGRYELSWPKVSLQDLLDVSRADLMEKQAETVNLQNWTERVRLGINSLEEMAKEFRGDLDRVPPGEVREILNGEDGLPKLVEEMPPPEPVQVAAMKQPDADAGNPRDEATTAKAWVSAQVAELVGNGNGSHP